MPSGYKVDEQDLDDIFLPLVFSRTADCGYKSGTQDLSARYEASRTVADRSTTVTNLKIANGNDINTLYMSKDFVIVPTYAISPNKDTINETTDKTVTFTVNTTDVLNNTKLYWSINRTDLAPNAGDITIINGSATFSTTAIADLTVENYSIFTAQVKIGSQSGSVVAESKAIGLIDSSIPIPTYDISANTSQINEGGSVTFNIVTTNVNVGTPLYWIVDRGDVTPTNGSFNVDASGRYSFTVTANNDSTTEGTAYMYAYLRSGGIYGPTLDTSGAVTIFDTSLTPPAAPYLSWTITNYRSFRTYYQRLNWTAYNATSLTINGSGGALSGSYSKLRPSVNYIYRFVLYGPGGSTQYAVKV